MILARRWAQPPKNTATLLHARRRAPSPRASGPLPPTPGHPERPERGFFLGYAPGTTTAPGSAARPHGASAPGARRAWRRMSRRRGDRFLGLCWPLYDVHEARAAPDMPPRLRARLRALYAASEAYVCAEVAAEHRPRGLGGVVLAAVRLGWVAGIIVGRLSVVAAPETYRGPVGSDVVDPLRTGREN